ncbi:ParB/RepB/Spo0J family partition protein [Streptomyces sp. SID1328]|uniref:ParB/RepB/Spo0J family partition protein n=1 Tax=Streptomyces sp. SID1328 TaxID=2690250 RepID=UPI0013712E09|nr:ParB/RepB/Spo0J family partition protein [Streptomyces sp. SID1328]MYV43015.1 ParB/RepB/Spo0J family partition protein [Streptomyces sp. SID1328]
MSKASQLGAGRFGGSGISARRQAVAAATGVPTAAVAPPTELPPHRISLNPDNPRTSLGDLSDLAGSLKTHGQKQAITVMNRDAYLAANPDREGDLEADTTHVAIDGNSRLAAAREAQLPMVKVMVSDDQGTNSEELLESALVANIHRQELAELDEAKALQRLLTIHGSQTALAKRLHRSQGWVSQRLALLNLTPALQARLNDEPIDLLRAVGNKPADEQEQALEKLKQERAQKEEAKRAKRREKSGGDASHAPTDATAYYDVIEGQTQSASRPVNASEGSTSLTTAEAVPEPRTGSSADGKKAPRTVPYDEPGSLALLLDRKIANDDTFFKLLNFLLRKGLERDTARLRRLARSHVEQTPDPED